MLKNPVFKRGFLFDVYGSVLYHIKRVFYHDTTREEWYEKNY